MPDFLTRFVAANLADPPGLQVLFDGPPDIPADALRAGVRDFHPTLGDATVELVAAAELPADELVNPDGPPLAVAGLVAWANHRVKLLFFAGPMPAGPVEVCLRPALMPAELKADARAHRAHALLYYAGSHADPVEQIAAVAAVAGSLARFGGIVTLNEEARAAVPSVALLPDEPGEDMWDVLRTLPLPYLYAGFVKMEVGDVPGVWVRTFAAPRFGLPNLALHLPGHGDGRKAFGLFAGVLGYLRETGLALVPGELVRIDDDAHVTAREPMPAEWWLDGGPLLVLDPS